MNYEINHKTLLTLATLGLLSSCGLIKSDEQVPAQEALTQVQDFNAKRGVDSDFDGISDGVEGIVGRDPFMTTFPYFFAGGEIDTAIQIEQDDSISIGSELEVGRSLDRAPLREMFSRMVYKKHLGEGNSLVPSLSHYGIIQVGNLRLGDLTKLESSLKESKDMLIRSQFKLAVGESKGIKRIKNVRAKLVRFDDEFKISSLSEVFTLQTVDARNLLIEIDENGEGTTGFYDIRFIAKVEGQKFLDAVKQSPNVFLKIEDFQMESIDSGKITSLQEQILKLGKRGQQVLYVSSSNEMLGYNHKEGTVDEVLKRINPKIKTDGSSVIEGDDIDVSSRDSINFSTISSAHLIKSNWTYVTNGKFLYELLDGSPLYVGFVKNLDILKGGNYSRKSLTVDMESVKAGFEIEDSVLGETVEISFKHEKSFPREGELLKYKAAANVKESFVGCNDDDGYFCDNTPPLYTTGTCTYSGTKPLYKYYEMPIVEMELFLSKEDLEPFRVDDDSVIHSIQVTTSEEINKIKIDMNVNMFNLMGEDFRLAFEEQRTIDFNYGVYAVLDCGKNTSFESWVSMSEGMVPGDTRAKRRVTGTIKRYFSY